MTDTLRDLTRRHFFRQAGFGIGSLALASLIDERLLASAGTPHPHATDGSGAADAVARTIAPHFAPRAKQIIYLFMAGAPSQIDLFDHKPKLQQYDGQPIPADIVKGERFAFIKGTPRLLGSPFTFQKHGRSAAEMSTLLPHLAKHADEIAIVRSMTTTQFNHAPGQIFMNTGHQIIGRPSLGSWLSYGLGSENTDLPAFVVLMSGQNNPDGGSRAGAAGSCRRSTRVSSSDPKGSPSCFQPIRRALTRRPGASLSIWSAI